MTYLLRVRKSRKTKGRIGRRKSVKFSDKVGKLYKIHLASNTSMTIPVYVKGIRHSITAHLDARENFIYNRYQ